MLQLLPIALTLNHKDDSFSVLKKVPSATAAHLFYKQSFLKHKSFDDYFWKWFCSLSWTTEMIFFIQIFPWKKLKLSLIVNDGKANPATSHKPLGNRTFHLIKNIFHTFVSLLFFLGQTNFECFILMHICFFQGFCVLNVKFLIISSKRRAF